jgi:hypothetical protein
LEPDALMIAAGNKYRMLLEEKLWSAPSKNQAKILALETQLKAMQKKTPANSGGASQKDAASASGNNPRRRGGPKPKWMTTPPSAEDIANHVPKKMDGKTFYWCVKHNSYVMHHPTACTKVVEDKKPAATDKNGKDDEPALKLAQAMQAELDDESEASDRD